MRFMINPKAPKGFLSVLIPIMISMTQIRVEVRVGLNKGLGLNLGVKVLIKGQPRAKIFLFISEYF